MERRSREPICFTPKWTPEYETWTTRFMGQNRWRTDKINDVADLVQEAYFIFDYVAASYPRVINDKHFFSLYKRSVSNKMHDWSCRKSRRKAIEPAELPSDVSDFFIGRIGEVSNAGYVGALLNEAPEEMRLVLNYLSSNGLSDEGTEKRENMSMKLCRILGLPQRDVMADLRRMLRA
jgi:DNA-directed RNA polymerase specialized sigma24 family protein